MSRGLNSVRLIIFVLITNSYIFSQPLNFLINNYFRTYSQYDSTSLSSKIIFTCSSDRPVVESGDTISVNTYINLANNHSLNYEWSTTSGKILGNGAKVKWEFTGVLPGTYYSMVRITESNKIIDSCKVQAIVTVPLTQRDILRETGKSFLVRGENETKGYGLYSYLLLGSPPNDTELERYRELIETYLKIIPDILQLEKYIPINELNVDYLPVESKPTSEISVNWVLEHYDYARARFLLKNIHRANRVGPYILSYYKPLSDELNISEKYLFQDFSTVPVHLISLWVKEFLNQAAQERYWEQAKTQSFVIKLRMSIGILAEGLPGVKKALDEWISWIK